MSALPPEVLRVIEAGKGSFSQHALHESAPLGLEWADVVEVARTASSWKREKDEQGVALDGWKDTAKGRDRFGRLMYLTGKQVYLQGERRWHVVTFHEQRDEKKSRKRIQGLRR